MKLEVAEVSSDLDGESRAAMVPVCNCGARGPWFIFQIVGQDHSHLQCATCSESFCYMGKCKK